MLEESGLLDDLTKMLDYGEMKSRKRGGDEKLKKYRSLGIYQKLQIYNEVSCMRKKGFSCRQIQKKYRGKVRRSIIYFSNIQVGASKATSIPKLQ